jgi:hypothetical protein
MSLTDEGEDTISQGKEIRETLLDHTLKVRFKVEQRMRLQAPSIVQPVTVPIDHLYRIHRRTRKIVVIHYRVTPQRNPKAMRSATVLCETRLAGAQVDAT